MKRGFTLIETLVCIFILALLSFPTYRFIQICSNDIKIIEERKRDLNNIVSIYYCFLNYTNQSNVIYFYYEDGAYVIMNENDEKCIIYYDSIKINRRTYQLEVIEIKESSNSLLVFYNLNNKLYCFKVEGKDEEGNFNR